MASPCKHVDTPSTCMPVRGRDFPSLIRIAGGLLLRLPVPGADGVVNIPPPQSVVGQQTDIWPSWCLQLLIVASEYCAALSQFMTWAFPDDWTSLKAQVAGHAAQLIRTGAAVPPPAISPAGNTTASWQSRNAHTVWAAFTYCYFHGLPSAEPEDENGPQEWQDATRWLRRLVGEYGWQEQAPVYQAASDWAKTTLDRLQKFFPGVGGMSARDWAAAAERGSCAPLAAGVCGGSERAAHGEQRSYTPLSQLRRPAGPWTSLSRIKVGTKVGQRAPSYVAGSWGIPAEFADTNACALGYLVAADAFEALNAAQHEASQTSQAQSQAELQRQQVIWAGVKTVLSNNTAELTDGHEQYGYPSYLASCALGWKLALQQLPRLLEAAAGSAAEAGLAAADLAAAGLRMELMMPRDMALPNTQHCLQQLQDQLPRELLQQLLQPLQGLQPAPAAAEGVMQQLQLLLALQSDPALRGLL